MECNLISSIQFPHFVEFFSNYFSFTKLKISMTFDSWRGIWNRYWAIQVLCKCKRKLIFGINEALVLYHIHTCPLSKPPKLWIFWMFDIFYCSKEEWWFKGNPSVFRFLSVSKEGSFNFLTVKHYTYDELVT